MQRREFLKILSGVATALLIPARAAALIGTQLRKAGRYIMALPERNQFGALTRDGRTWSKMTLPDTYGERYFSDACWNGTIYCAVGDGYKFATSTNGTTWTQQTGPVIPDDGGSWSVIAWNGSVFCTLSYRTLYGATSPDGMTWTLRPIPISGFWRSLTWNGNVFCAVGDDHACMTSPDGITWTQRTLPSVSESAHWNAVATAGSTFCLINYNGTTATSTDATNWTINYGVLPQTGYTQANLTSNGSIFCTFNVSTGKSATSTDGITWTVGSSVVTSSSFGAVIRPFGSKFILQSRGSSTSECFVSSDGLNWTAGTVPNVQWFGGAASATTFVSVSNSGAITTTDGINWVSRSLSSTASWRDVAWNGSVFCAVAYGSNKACTSTDGITWTARTLPSTANWMRIIWNGSVFCALSTTTNKAATSPDGITWTARTLPSTSSWLDLAWNGSTFYAMGDYSSDPVATSATGTTWTGAYAPPIDNPVGKWYEVISSGTDLFALATQSRTIAKSTDNGANWTRINLPKVSQWSTMYSNGTTWVAAGYSSLATSTDGSTWTLRTAPGSFFVFDLIWFNSLFVAVGNSYAFSSPDGITWTARTFVATNSSNSLTTNGTNLIAVGSDGVSHGSANPVAGSISTNGTTWSSMTMTSLPIKNGYWFGAAWNGKVFVATSDYCVLSSRDGVNWTVLSLAQSDSWEGCVYVNGRFVISGWSYIGTSTDGASWTFVTNWDIGEGICDMIWTGTTYVGIVQWGEGVISTTTSDFSTINWPTMNDDADWTSIEWNGSVMCVVGNQKDICSTSPDGVTWTDHAFPILTDWASVRWNGQVFCTVGRDSNVALTSKNGATWTQHTLPLNTSWSGLSWNGKFFIAVSDSGKFATSADGATWSLGTLPTTFKVLTTS